MKKRLLTFLILTLTPISVSAINSYSSTTQNFPASGVVIPAVTVSLSQNMVFPGNLLSGDNPSQITTLNYVAGALPGQVTVAGCYGTDAYINHPTTINISNGTTSYTVTIPNGSPVNNPQGTTVTFVFNGWIYNPGILVAGTFIGTLPVEAGCSM